MTGDPVFLNMPPAFIGGQVRRAVQADSELDTQGLLCPEPLMLLRNHVREMGAGDVVHILATDPTTQRDFSQFCHFMGHEMIASDLSGAVLHYWIRKAG